MSAAQSPRPLPSPVPSPAPVSPPEPRQGWRKWALGAVLAGGVAGLGYWGYRQTQNAPAAPVAIMTRTAAVTRGPLVVSNRVTGQTSARRYANIAAPSQRGPEGNKPLVLLKLVPPGAAVKKGQVVAQIDAQAMADHVIDVADMVEAAEADIRKRRAEQAVDWENLMQTVRVAKADYEKAKLDAAAAEVRTTIDRELLQLAVDETGARYKQLQHDLDTKKIAQAAEIRILELTRERHKRHHDRHAVDVTRFTFTAPMDGLTVMQSTWRGGEMGQVQEGDQVYPGMLFMKVVNPNSMQVEAYINQTESSQFRIGQAVKVHLDAFPGAEFPGKVYSIGALAQGGWRYNAYIRNIPVRIAIEGADPRLIPDLSASGDVELNRVDNAVQVPLAALMEENGKQGVFVKQGGGFAWREVRTGLHSNDMAAVLAGLQPGEEVALQRPAAPAQ